MTRARVGAPWFRRLCLGLLTVWFPACADDEPNAVAPVDECTVAHDGAAVDLLGFSNWEILAEAEDPWAVWRDRSEDCSDPAPRVEEGTLEFDTKLCSSYSVRAPLLAPLQPGDTVTLVGSHSTLLADSEADSGALGHLEVWVAGVPLFDFQTQIPRQASVITLEVASTVCAPAGADLQIHVRNHGANSWRINQIRRQAR